MSEFKWTDELVKEFMKDFVIHPNWKTFGDDWIEEFKASKQPKPEWEIESFLMRGNTWHKCHYRTEGIQYESNGQYFTLGWGLNIQTEATIYSVRRLTDGQLFTVGDWVKDMVGNELQITEFNLANGDLYIELKGPSRPYWTYRLKDLIKVTPEHCIPVLLTPSQIEKLLTLLNTTP